MLRIEFGAAIALRSCVGRLSELVLNERVQILSSGLLWIPPFSFPDQAYPETFF